MKRKLPLAFLAGLVLGVCSCSQVKVKEPFGTQPAELDPEVWNGVWRMDGGEPGQLTVSKDKPGEFIFSEVPDPKAEPKEKADDLTVAVRDVDGDLFFTVIAEGEKKAGDEEAGGLLWGRIAMNDNTAVVWLPDVDKFAALVKDGTLPGKDTRKKNEDTGVTAGGIVLDNLEEKHLELIAKGTRGVLFAWDEPIVLVRVPWREPREEEPAGGQ